jgi:hypothetical protein
LLFSAYRALTYNVTIDFRLENVLLQLTRSTEEFLVQDSPPATSGNGAVTTFEFPVPDGLLTPNELAVPSIRLIDFSRGTCWIPSLRIKRLRICSS